VGREGIVTYAFTYFYAGKDQEAELWLGNEEAISVYLNGAQVYTFTSYNSYGIYDRGTNKATIQLKEGRNTLLVKSLNEFGDYNFALNICEVENDPDFLGNRVAGLKFYIDESGTGTQLTGIHDREYPDISDLICYPNPATDHLTIRFAHNSAVLVNVKIIDMGGKFISSLADEHRQPGMVEYAWDLTTEDGSRVKSGVYLCTISCGEQQRSIRVVVK
jgi:hypothetical protein